MSDAVLIAALAAIPPTLTAIASLLYIRGLHKKINSRMDELITIARKDSRAEGFKAGRKKH